MNPNIPTDLSPTQGAVAPRARKPRSSRSPGLLRALVRAREDLFEALAPSHGVESAARLLRDLDTIIADERDQ